MKSRQTRFSDVCGTMDELKRLHHEEHETVTRDPIAVIKPLLEDAMYMLNGMQERIGEYDDYRNRVRAAMGRLEKEIRTVIDPAITAMKFMEDAMESNQRYGATDVADISNAAEAIQSNNSANLNDLIPPTVTFNPGDNSTGIPLNSSITLTFSEAIRRIDDSEINNNNVSTLLVLKDNDANGSEISFF